MKIIATSIVLLAAAASAGESSLRIGRELKAPGNGNGNNAGGKGKGAGTPAATGKGTGMGYGARCCAQYDGDQGTDANPGCEQEDGTNCDTDGLHDGWDLSGFNQCVYDTGTEECTHEDVDSGE